MNWFERHLNWSLFFGTFLLPFGVGLIFSAIWFAILWGQLSAAGSGMDGFSEELFTATFASALLENIPIIIISGLIYLAMWVFGLIVMWWYLGQKARSKWFMLLYFVPWGLSVIQGFINEPADPSTMLFSGIFAWFILIIGFVDMIIFYCLGNRAIGYGGDFGDYLVREPATDQWADTRQYGTPDDWRPKDLDYSPQKNIESLAFGGSAKDVGDAGVPSGEVPAEPPVAVPPKASADAPPEVTPDVPIETPLETPATDVQEKVTAEASADVPTGAPEQVVEEPPDEALEEAPAEAVEEVPVEPPAAAAEAPERVIAEVPAMEAVEELLAESPAEALKEAPEEISAEPATAPVAEAARGQPVSQMPILLDDTGAVIKCFYHSDADAVNRCSRCGQYVCNQCNYVTGTHPICRNCWDRRTEVPLSVVSAGKQESPRSGKPDKSKAGKEERAREFVQLYEQALPVINAVITRGPDGLTASPLDLAEGLKLRPMLEYAKKLPKFEGKELQEAKKEFEQLCTACIKIAEKAADFFSAGGQTIPTEEDFARLVDSIEKASALMGELYPKMASLSQPQE